MSDAPPSTDKKSPTEILAALVAQRRAASGRAPGAPVGGKKGVERAAAARATAMSKPALRK
jgi:hypothetical protein